MIDIRNLPDEELSAAERFALRFVDIPASGRKSAIAKAIATASDDNIAHINSEWRFTARPDQIMPFDFSIWLMCTGRGTGKTLAASNATIEHAMRPITKQTRRTEGLIIGPTAADVRAIMVEGPSGILAQAQIGLEPLYEPSKRLITFPGGYRVHTRSADEPDIGIRGLSLDWAWADEICFWRFLDAAWHNLRMSMREGRNPRTVITTTPRPLPLLRDLLAKKYPNTVVSARQSTFRNANNLSRLFIDEMISVYEGTTIGKQELEGMLLDTVEGAAFWPLLLEKSRFAGEWEVKDGTWVPKLPQMNRRVVVVDPPGSATGAEAGIMVLVRDSAKPPNVYLLEDCSLRGSPGEWGQAAVDAYYRHSCDMLIGERNYGGDMVKAVVEAVQGGRGVRYKDVGARHSKTDRAKSVVPFYEKGRVIHVGPFSQLEDQMISYVQGDRTSPDRLDALVHGLRYLLIDIVQPGTGRSYGQQVAHGRIPGLAK